MSIIEDYRSFLATKRHPAPSSGLACTPEDVNPALFDFQRHITALSVRRGRGAVWAATGLGKTRIQAEWLRLTRELAGGDGLILAPLGVAAQTVREAAQIGIHADFLGVMSPAEMRSTFFIADSRGEFMRYRLKGHARQAFYDWLASWAVACRTPADLGFDDTAYHLPELRITDHVIETGWSADGELFTPRLEGVTQRAQVRRDTLATRVAESVALIRAEPGEQWLAWCGMNAEADAITAAIPGAVNVQGSDDPDVKAARLLDFAEGRLRVLVTKPSLAGFGLNFQACARMVFCGLSDSYEMYHQAIRRCWRFGQKRPVDVHIVLADAERVIAENVRAKERAAGDMNAGLVAAIAEQNRRELFTGTSRADSYEPVKPLSVPDWLRSAS